MPSRLNSVVGAAVAALGFCLPQSLIANDDPGTVRGVVRAASTAKISSALVARINGLPFKVGQSFNKGEILVSFDCSRYQAELRAAEAEVKVHSITVDQNRRLLQSRAVGRSEFAISEARQEQARAKADAIRLQLGQCSIAAPFEGRIAERLVDVHELPRANTPLLTVVKLADPELDLIVPSNWMTWLRAGQPFVFEIEETGTRHRSEVLHLGATVDAVSRTIKVSARLLEPTTAIRPGMSGVAVFDRSKGQ